MDLEFGRCFGQNRGVYGLGKIVWGSGFRVQGLSLGSVAYLKLSKDISGCETMSIISMYTCVCAYLCMHMCVGYDSLRFRYKLVDGTHRRK